jgi:hypothetical protein
MGVTKKDISGVFNTKLTAARSDGAVTLDQVSHLSSKGITFQTTKALPEWTELDVKMRLPQAGSRPSRPVDCHGVVVQCARRSSGPGFNVSLLFLDFPKRAATRLASAPVAALPTHISIAR